MSDRFKFLGPSYRGKGLPREVEATLDLIVQGLGTLSEMIEESKGESRASVEAVRQQTAASLAGLIGARGQTLIGETSTDPLLNQIPTGNGTVTTVSGGTTGFTFTTATTTPTLAVSNAATIRTAIGLGTIAPQNANNVTITGGSVSGITDLAVADGGTGASTAANARTNLGIDAIATKLSKLDATAAPTVNEDSGDGYAIGSIWVDVTADQVYMATDVTVGAAVWKQLS